MDWTELDRGDEDTSFRTGMMRNSGRWGAGPTASCLIHLRHISRSTAQNPPPRTDGSRRKQPARLRPFGVLILTGMSGPGAEIHEFQERG